MRKYIISVLALLFVLINPVYTLAADETKTSTITVVVVNRDGTDKNVMSLNMTAGGSSSNICAVRNGIAVGNTAGASSSIYITTSEQMVKTSEQIGEEIKERKKKEKQARLAAKKKAIEETVVATYNVPLGSGKKTYMDYRCLKGNNPQTRLQSISTTDSTGIRVTNGRYCVAVGSYFNINIGQYFALILQNGTVIKCVKADAKADNHTDSSGIYTVNSGCMSEFIVQTSALNSSAKRMGDISYTFKEWDSPVVKVVVYKGKAL